MKIAVSASLPVILMAAGSTFGVSTAALAQTGNDVSPARQIQHDQNQSRQRHGGRHNRFELPIDGSGHNRENPEMNATGTPLARLAPSDYADGISAMAGGDRPSARAVSNSVAFQEDNVLNPRKATDYLWQWGQFLDHDIDLTEGADPAEPAPIAVPSGDVFFDPAATGTKVIDFNRSIYDEDSGTSAANPREQINEITGWIDASNVYGSDEVRANALRRNDGSGKLKTSQGRLLPFNTAGLPNAGGHSADLFLAGDVRANEQSGLASMHTLFVREHNRLARKLKKQHPRWSGDRIYAMARRIVAAEMQVITYKEFLPALLGNRGLAPYYGYNKHVDARITNEFSGAAYRFGHSALSPTLLRLDAAGNEIAEGHLPLRGAFFNPAVLTEQGGIEPLLRGLAAQHCQRIDTRVVDDVRNFLFGPPGAGGFDLVSLNIQRGRDHGLQSYNNTRRALGLTAATNFADISSDPEVQARLASVYSDVEQVDLWVGGLSEDPLPRGHLGELFAEIVATQFEALRDGDRFWYARKLPAEWVEKVESWRLRDIIARNTKIKRRELQRNVFKLRNAQ